MLNCSLFSSVAQACPTLCDPMNCSMPSLPVHHQLPEFTQIHVHQVGDAIQPSHPLSSPSPPAPNPSQHQGLFQWVNFSHEVAKVLGFQLQHQSFQRTPFCSLLEKCKSKPQWDFTSHWSEWPLSKSLQTISAGEGVEKREPSCTVCGNVNWYNHYGRQYED